MTLWHWKGPRRSKVITHVRVDMLMLEPDYIGTGIAFLLLAELVDRIRNRGYARTPWAVRPSAKPEAINRRSSATPSRSSHSKPWLDPAMATRLATEK